MRWVPVDLSALAPTGEPKMPIPIQAPFSSEKALRLSTEKTGRHHEIFDAGLLMLWAVVMLSIGAVVHFSALSRGFNNAELQVPF